MHSIALYVAYAATSQTGSVLCTVSECPLVKLLDCASKLIVRH